jgi:hypothetical protein
MRRARLRFIAELMWAGPQEFNLVSADAVPYIHSLFHPVSGHRMSNVWPNLCLYQDSDIA